MVVEHVPNESRPASMRAAYEYGAPGHIKSSRDFILPKPDRARRAGCSPYSRRPPSCRARQLMRIVHGDARPRQVAIEPLFKIYDTFGHHHCANGKEF
jgi:hypothetical protein